MEVLMKGITGAVILTAGALLMTGCAGPRPAAREVSPHEILQEQADAMNAAGGVAVVGRGTSRAVQVALETAKVRGRQELADAFTVRIDALRDKVLEEIDEDEDSEYSELFASARRTIASRILQHMVPQDLQYEATDSQTTAWALMVLEPKVIADALAAQADSQRHAYTRFRASQAADELDQAVSAFQALNRRTRR